MSISEVVILAMCDRDAARLDKYMPGYRKTCMFVLADGQSQVSGNGSDNSIPITFNTGDAWTTSHDQTDLNLLEMQGISTGSGGAGRHGAATFVYGFAKHMKDTFGITVVSAMSAWQGTRLLPETPSSSDWSFSIDDVDVDFSMVRSSMTLGQQTRNEIIEHALKTIRIRPELKLESKIVLWAQGDADRPHLGTGVITQNQFTQGLNEYWGWRKNQEQFDLMAVFEHGVTGTDAIEIADNEYGCALLRGAQADFVEDVSNVDVIWGSRAAKESGPLVVDAQGVHVSGFSYDVDGVHWTGAANTAQGREAALAVALKLGHSLTGYGNDFGNNYGTNHEN
jgi:hypothetical protein